MTQAAKLGGIAATYRAGKNAVTGTCPVSCPLLPECKRKESAKVLDVRYATAEAEAVPRRGTAWSYSHFPALQLAQFKDAPTKINFSADTIQEALEAAEMGLPTVYAAPINSGQWPQKIDGRRFIQCPAETAPGVTCATCGGDTPLCARTRDYVVVFMAHGNQKKRIGTGNGGCYALNMPCVIQWESTRQGTGKTTWDESQESETLVHWARSLPTRSKLRHRIAGDLGLE